MREEDENNIANGWANMSEQELKPCPFCEKRASVHLEDVTGCYDRSIRYKYQPGCETDGCPGEYGGCSYDTEDAAIAAFNTRHPDPLLEELARALQWISEDGHAMASMTIGSRNRILAALQKYQQSKVQP